MHLRTEREISEAYAAQTGALGAAGGDEDPAEHETEEWTARLLWVDRELDLIPEGDVSP